MLVLLKVLTRLRSKRSIEYAHLVLSLLVISPYGRRLKVFRTKITLS
jgi:hypothetical protein